MPIIICPVCGCDVNVDMFCNQCGWHPEKIKPYSNCEPQPPKTLDDVIELAILQSEVSRLEAENARMREVLSRVVNVLDGIGMIADDYQDISGIVRDWQKKSVLSPSTDESEPTDD